MGMHACLPSLYLFSYKCVNTLLYCSSLEPFFYDPSFFFLIFLVNLNDMHIMIS